MRQSLYIGMILLLICLNLAACDVEEFQHSDAGLSAQLSVAIWEGVALNKDGTLLTTEELNRKIDQFFNHANDLFSNRLEFHLNQVDYKRDHWRD